MCRNLGIVLVLVLLVNSESVLAQNTAKTAKNIVFIILDDLRFDGLGFLNPQVETPNICLLYTSPSPRDRH